MIKSWKLTYLTDLSASWFLMICSLVTKKGGCDVSLLTLNTVVNHFVKNKTDVLLVSLDATEAFDRINVFRLLTILLKRGLPVVLARFLLSLFTNTNCEMAWKGLLSCAFDIKKWCETRGNFILNIF